jgi:hypothetical protein
MNIPFYASVTGQVIRDKATKVVHPTTGQVYGGTDFDDNAKCAQIGAWPVTTESDPQPENPVCLGEELVLNTQLQTAALIMRWRSKTVEELAEEEKQNALQALVVLEQTQKSIRKLEDLVDTLITKNVIAKTDLPAIMQTWMDERAAERAKL